MAYVYEHKRLDTGCIFYVGIGLKDDPKHKRAYDKSGRNCVWKKIVAKTDYEVTIIADNLSVDEAKTKEIEKIAEYGRMSLGIGTLCNLTAGGDGALGLACTEEAKVKSRERMLGEGNPNYGKYGEESSSFGRNHSDETKAKISEKARGRVTSEETKQKLSLALKGRVISEETRAKMSEAQRGENHPNFGKKASDETKRKMSEIRTGRRHTEESKLKMSRPGDLNPMFGKVGELSHRFGKQLSDKTKKLISNSNKGKRMGVDNPRSRLVLDMYTGIFYYSASEAHRELNLRMSERHFNAMLLGKYPNKTSCIYA